MKTKDIFKQTLLVLMALLGSITASAYDFSAENADGKEIYYNYTSSTTVEVSYRANASYGDCYDGYGDIIIPSTVEYNGKTYTVTGIGYNAFNNADITSINLPNTIERIESLAFSDCSGLSSLTIPENVTHLGFNIVCRGDNDHPLNNLKTLFYNAKHAESSQGLGGTIFCVGSDCEVIIGEEVECLPNSFLKGSEITSINIPERVTVFGDFAFYNCTNLTFIEIPKNVTQIGISAFEGCSSLRTVIARPLTPPTMSYSAFGSNRALITLFVPEGCVTNYTSSSSWNGFKETLEPSRIIFVDSRVEALCVERWDNDGNGYLDKTEAVKVINLGTVFQGNTQITSFSELQFFMGIAHITNNSFAGCTNLSEISLPETVSSIDESAFAECVNLTVFALPENLTAIGDNAFKNCSSLSTITLPTSMKTIGNCAFMGCSRLASILNLEKIYTIGESAFANCTNLCSASFSAHTVNSNTFQGCTSLTSVTLGPGVDDIMEGAFKNCTALTTISFKKIAGNYNIYNAVFQGCSSLTSITFPDGLAYIGENVFDGTGLTSINIPSTVTNIQSNAFAGCVGLKSVTINWPIPLAVPADAFPDRDNQVLIVPQGTKESYLSADVWKDFRWIREFGAQGIEFADANVEAICLEHWDLDLDGLLQPEEAAAVTSLMAFFRGNTEITSFDELRYFTGLANIPANAFNECTNLTSITLPEGVTIIASYAFRGCSSLTSIIVPEGVTDIYGYVFQNCTSLNTVILPESLNSLGISAFWGCSSLTDIDLPDGLMTIGQYGFSNCTSLTFLDIPSSVNSIGASTFNGCTNLKAFGVHWTTPITVVASTFPNRANQALYVPEGTKATYQATDVWKDFKWILEPSDCEAYVIFNDADSTLTFYYDGLKPTRTGTAYSLNTGNTNPGWYNKRADVAHVVIDASFGAVHPTTTYSWFNGMFKLKDFTNLDVLNTSEVTNMHWMFYGCKNLASLDLSHFDTGNVTDMGGMFNGCNVLESLGVSHFNTQNVTDMSSMFYGCMLLTSLDVRNFDTQNVTTMNSMFSACNALTSLDVSGFNTAKVTNMASMFSGCKTLTSLDVTNLNTAKVTNMNAMFQSCSGLTSLDLTTFNTSLVTNMQGMFTSCTGLTELDLSSFDTHNVTNMYYMFGGGSVGTVPCANLVTVYVGNEWSTAAVTNSSGMFQGCTSIVGGKGTTYDAGHVDKAYARVDGGPSDPGYFSSHVTFLRGDVDDSGNVNIDDVTALIDYLLGTNTGINLQGADCDESGNISIDDVTALIDYLLSGHW